MYKFWLNEDPNYVLPDWQCLEEIHQGTFASLAKRGYVEYKPRLEGFKCTEFGWEVKKRWEEGMPKKLHSSARFGAFLRQENPTYLDGRFKVLEAAEGEGKLERKTPGRVTIINKHRRVA
jgi:hypothetical protein